MKKLLYIVALLFLIFWVLGKFVWFITNALINLLLVAALVFALISLIKKKPSDK
ncbi:DUF5670 family protein [Flavobacterium album]|uniref:DUF5670 family protein n=1 Tax=Flavobacterium album TaxID=2175091 RepID=UPI0015E824CF|nr:DUF5670 family protein [Flavobacterium album]